MKQKIVMLMLAGMLTFSNGMYAKAEEAQNTEIQNEVRNDSEIEVLERAGSGGSFITIRGSVSITEEVFPDEKLRNYVKQFDKDNDGILSEEERAAVLEINISGMGISSLEGIQVFDNLITLYCNDNNIEILHLSGMGNLSRLEFGNNPLKSVGLFYCSSLIDLNIDEEEIGKLEIEDCDRIEDIDINKTKANSVIIKNCRRLRSICIVESPINNLGIYACDNLENISAHECGLTELDIMENPELRDVNVSDNKLTAIKMMHCPRIEALDISKNAFEYLDLHDFEKLTYLNCSGNQLSNILVDENNCIETIDINENAFTQFDFSQFKKLNKAYLDNNKIKELVVPEDSALTTLSCAGNQMDKLEVKNKELQTLICSDNLLESIDLSNSKYLNKFNGDSNRFTEIDFSNNNFISFLSVSNNILKELDVSNCGENLVGLTCRNCNLKELNLKNLVKLTYLECDNNQLTSLELPSQKLKNLNCSKNNIGKIELANFLVLAYEQGEKTQDGDVLKWTYLDETVKNEENKYVLVLDAATEVIGNRFKDVDSGSWQYLPVCYVWEKGYMIGKGAEDKIIFAPNDTMTRAEFVQVLYNMEGKPEIEFSEIFKDVTADQWYTNAVIWAKKKNIVAGKGDVFDVFGKVTREEMATMLRNFASYKKYELTASDALNKFSDKNEISSWAVENMKWAVGNKIMSGKGSNLGPKDMATRAECATMIKNMCDKLAE